MLTVIGVVPDTRYRDLREARPSIYFPLNQSFFPFAPTSLAIRTERSSEPITAIRRVIGETAQAWPWSASRRSERSSRAAGAAQNERSSSVGVRGCCVDHSDCRSVWRHGGDGPPAYTRARHSARLGGHTMGSAADGHAPRAHSRNGRSALGSTRGIPCEPSPGSTALNVTPTDGVTLLVATAVLLGVAGLATAIPARSAHALIRC